MSESFAAAASPDQTPRLKRLFEALTEPRAEG